jgi:hypothetical protein
MLLGHQVDIRAALPAMVVGVLSATPSGAVMLMAGRSAAIAAPSALLPAASSASAWCWAANSPGGQQFQALFHQAACSLPSSCLPLAPAVSRRNQQRAGRAHAAAGVAAQLEAVAALPPCPSLRGSVR